MTFILVALSSFLLAISSTLGATESGDRVEVLALGTSYHGAWSGKGRPNQVNLGEGLMYAHRVGDESDAVEAYVQIGGALYDDSFSRLAGVAMSGFSFRIEREKILLEASVDMAYWRGSGNKGMISFAYAGVGYDFGRVQTYVEGTYDPFQQLTMGWLKFSVPVN